MIIFLIKFSLIIIVLFGFYKLFLERESFFAANRIYLLCSLAFACAIPFITLPEIIERQGVVTDLVTSPFNNDAKEYPKVNTQIEDASTVEDQVNESAALNEIATTPVETKTSWVFAPKGISQWLLVLYFFGVLVLSANLLIQIISTFFKVLKNDDQIKDDDGVIVNLNKKIEPCSFFKFIFINPELYDYDTYEQIIVHEKIHVKKLHSIDLLLTEMAVVLLWFNPFIWLFRKEVEKNIEYQTDDILLTEKSEVKERYQLNLVEIASFRKPATITTNYNQSLIKQRIMKMNAKKSSNFSYWKYAFVFPLTFLLLLVLNKPVESFASVSIANNQKPEKNPATATITTITTTVIESNEEEKVKLSPVKVEKTPVVVTKTQATSKSRTSTEKNENEETSDREIALIEAARGGHIDVIEYLLEKGVNLNFISHNHGTALITSSGHGHIEVIKYLLSKGAEVDLISANHGTALIAAANHGHTEAVKLLLEKGAEVNKVSANHGTALIAAANHGHTKAAKLLLEKGAEVNQISANQGTALIAAANHGHIEAVKLLLEKGAEVNLNSSNQGTALIAAANHGHTEAVKLLLEKGAEVNQISANQGTALIAAANHGHIEAVKLLLEKGAEVNLNSSNQGTALIVAAKSGHLILVDYLLSKGAKVNYVSPNHGTALIAASGNGHLDMVKVLLEKKADVNVLSPNHGTALMRAIDRNETEIARYLLDKGADYKTENHGKTALTLAYKRMDKELIELIESKMK